MNGAYGRADGDALLAPERDARTGRRVPSSRSRQNKRGHDQPARVRTQPKVLVAAGVVAIVLAIGVGVAIAASDSGDDKHSTGAPKGTNGGAGPATSDAVIPGGADFVNVAFNQSAPTVVTNTGQYRNLSANDVAPYLAFVCSRKGCGLVLDGHNFFEGSDLDIKAGVVDYQPAANGHWHIVRRGTRSECPPESHTAVGTWDLVSSGATQALGVAVPKRITGTFTFATTAEADAQGFVCNAASNVKVKYDGEPGSTFATNATGTGPAASS